MTLASTYTKCTYLSTCTCKLLVVDRWLAGLGDWAAKPNPDSHPPDSKCIILAF